MVGRRTAFIGVGSNIGDREGNLARALAGLGDMGLGPVRVSSVYRTEPVEVVDQEEFLNQVVAVETDLPAAEIVRRCLLIEERMGRVRARPRGPRLIDLDLILLGEEVSAAGGAEVPHPRMHLRRFVLVPLAEIAPGARHPVLGSTVAQILARCADRSRVERVG